MDTGEFTAIAPNERRVIQRRGGRERRRYHDPESADRRRIPDRRASTLMLGLF